MRLRSMGACPSSLLPFFPPSLPSFSSLLLLCHMPATLHLHRRADAWGLFVCVCVEDQPAAWQTGIRVWDAAGIQLGWAWHRVRRCVAGWQPAALSSPRAIHPHQGVPDTLCSQVLCTYCTVCTYPPLRKCRIGDGSATRLLATLLTPLS